MVTKSGSVTLGKNRDIKLTYDQSSKAHLTTAKGVPNKADYTPVARVYHGKRLSVDPAHIDIDEQYSGVAERMVPSSWIDAFYADGHGALDPALFGGLHAQQFLLLTAEDNPSKTALGRVDTRADRIRMVGRHKEGVWGIFARNKEQLFALDLLLDDNISLVTLNGIAEIQIHSLARAHAEALVADVLGIARGHIAGDQIAEARVFLLEVVIAFFLGNVVGPASFIFFSRHPDSPVISQAFAHER